MGSSMPRSEKKHVFVSHATGDKKKYVLPFIRSLAKAGITCWIDNEELNWGESIAERLNDGLANADFVVVFITREFLARRWTRTELSAALTREVNEGRSLVLPIVTDETR